MGRYEVGASHTLVLNALKALVKPMDWEVKFWLTRLTTPRRPLGLGARLYGTASQV